MQIIAPPKVSTETVAAFFAAMRLWLLEAVAPFVLHVSTRVPFAHAMRAWLDAGVRDGIMAMRQMLFAMAVAQLPPRRVMRLRRDGLRPGTSPRGFRAASRCHDWFWLATRDLRRRGGGLGARLALLRDLVAHPARWIAKIIARVRRVLRSRKGARFTCVAPPVIGVVGAVTMRAPSGADTS